MKRHHQAREVVEFVSGMKGQLDITALKKIEVSTLTREKLQAEISTHSRPRDITQ